ncbi:MAG: hypothetical protein ACNS60_10985 [Candidatus Cyclobacteriaceae bacterium M2_1C_046]
MFGIKSRVEKYFLYKGLAPAEDNLFDNNLLKQKFEKTYQESFSRFKDIYTNYTSSISSKEMAVSLETCACLYTFCHVFNVKKILEMGSGLSSYVFRTYQKEVPDVEVYSIDDNEEWLSKTHEFLSSHSLSTDKIFTLQQFLLQKDNSFDLVFHDLNFVEERIKHVDFVIDRSATSSFMIFDDVHKPNYYSALAEKLKQHKLPFFSLKRYTHDQFDRFSIVAKHERF